MIRIEKVLGILNTGQLEVFRGLQHCLKAARLAVETTAETHTDGKCSLATAKSFIKEILYELETRKKMEFEMWSRLKEEYNIGDKDFSRLEINPDSGELCLLNKEFVDNVDLRKFNVMWGGN